MSIRKSDLPKIRKQKNGAFYAQMYSHTNPDGKRVFRSFYGYDKTALMREMVQFKAEKQEGRQRGRANMTLREAMDAYISAKSAVLSPSTIKGYKAIQRNFLQSIIDERLCDLTHEGIQRAVNEDATHLSPKTIRNAHGLLTAVVDLYRPDFKPSATLPQRRKTEITVPTTEEVHRLLDTADGTPMYLAVMLGACCGMRRSEISGLTWECVDMSLHTLTIRQAVVVDSENRLTAKTTKTTAGTRVIKMLPMVYQALLEEQERTQPKPTDPVSIPPDHISHRFGKLLKKAGVRHFRFHDLRHYTISVMLSLNVPKKYIADYVGHETENMIDRVYGHVMQDKKGSVEEQMQGYFSGEFLHKK